MNPEKQRAEALINKFTAYMTHVWDFEYGEKEKESIKIRAKKCALIMVDEILNGAHIWQFIEGSQRMFWNEVKQEIEKS